MTSNDSGLDGGVGDHREARKIDQLGSSITSTDTQSDAATQAVTIVIGGEPVAKGRPRMTRKGFVYTPSATRKYEAHGRFAAQVAMNGRPPFAVPCRVDITIDLPVSASWSGKRRDAALRGEIKPTVRPDVDNYTKSAMDAINNIVVSDDSLVVDLVVTKKYAAVPQLAIRVTPLPALTAQGRSA